MSLLHWNVQSPCVCSWPTHVSPWVLVPLNLWKTTYLLSNGNSIIFFLLNQSQQHHLALDPEFLQTTGPYRFHPSRCPFVSLFCPLHYPVHCYSHQWNSFLHPPSPKLRKPILSTYVIEAPFALLFGMGTSVKRWRTPNSSKDPNVGPSSSGRKRNRGTLPSSQHLRGRGACWSSGMGLGRIDKLHSLIWACTRPSQSD
jgi:hypothetical protein